MCIRDSTLAEIRSKGKLSCGVGGQIRGFSHRQGEDSSASSDYSGLEALLCKAIAISVFGHWQDRISWFETDIDSRFESLRNGVVDVLLRNTTWTSEREAMLGVSFGPVYYHDGQKILTKVEYSIDSHIGLADKSICVMPSGSTSIVNIDSYLERNGVSNYESVSYTHLTLPTICSV